MHLNMSLGTLFVCCICNALVQKADTCLPPIHQAFAWHQCCGISQLTVIVQLEIIVMLTYDFVRSLRLWAHVCLTSMYSCKKNIRKAA